MDDLFNKNLISELELQQIIVKNPFLLPSKYT